MAQKELSSASSGSYQETLEYLYARLPMFTRVGDAALKADLTNTLALCRHIGNPQHKFKTIHIAGTNGKGSSSHMLAAILQTAGYKTGLYTSPHLRDFRERIRVNGQMIPENNVIDFVESQKQLIEEIEPSFFEVTVAMAFQHFEREKVDIAVIEVGLGGRLDSTNIITPLLSLITNIGFDHVNILGDTLPKIASEKAGIIKPGVPVVIGERHPETMQVFIDKAIETHSELTFAADEWNISAAKGISSTDLLEVEVQSVQHDDNQPPHYKSLALDLTGSYQVKNVAGVLSAIEKLRQLGFNISDEHVKIALTKVKSLTGLMGRWQILKRNPLVVCDTGHNEDGIKEVLKNIRLQIFEKLHMVIGMVRDKDISKILGLLPPDATYYFCSPDIPRAKPVDELLQEASQAGLKGTAFNSVAEALYAAESKASEADLIFVGGSTFVVAEIV